MGRSYVGTHQSKKVRAIKNIWQIKENGWTDAPDRQVYRKRHTHRGMTDKGRREEGSFGERPKGIGEKGREQGRKRERERKENLVIAERVVFLSISITHARTWRGNTQGNLLM